MKQPILCFRIGIFLVMLMAVAFCASADDFNDYYPLAKGNRWKYVIIEKDQQAEEEIIVEGVEDIDGLPVFKLSSGENDYMLVTAQTDGFQVLKNYFYGTSEIFSPPKALYYVNKEKSFSHIKVSGPEKNTRNGLITVISQAKPAEDITVPAGNFKQCRKFSIRIDEKFSGSNRADSNFCTVWFAKGVGKVKESCVNIERNLASSETTELVSAVIAGRQIGVPDRAAIKK